MKQHAVLLTDDAQADLQELYDYIAQFFGHGTPLGETAEGCDHRFKSSLLSTASALAGASCPAM